MLRLLRSKRAQNTMEYAILISVVIGVFTAMQIYMRRGLQARVKAGADNVPDMVIATFNADDQGKVQNLFGDQTQYDPYYTREAQYQMQTTSSEGLEKGTIADTGDDIGGVRELTDATVQRTGTQAILGTEGAGAAYSDE